MFNLLSLRGRFAELSKESHPSARLFLGLSCLGAGLATSSIQVAANLLATVVILLYLIGTPVTNIVRALRILAFLIVPILVLHMLFTPGRLLFDFGAFGHISAEGLQKGAWLSLHLMLMYFAAMLFSRLLSMREWMSITAFFGGKQIQAYVILVSPMARQVRWRMQSLSKGRRQRGTWRELALTLAEAVNQSLAVSHMLAELLWLRWPDQAVKSDFQHTESKHPGAWLATFILALISLGVLAVVSW